MKLFEHLSIHQEARGIMRVSSVKHLNTSHVHYIYIIGSFVYIKGSLVSSVKHLNESHVDYIYIKGSFVYIKGSFVSSVKHLNESHVDSSCHLNSSYHMNSSCHMYQRFWHLVVGFLQFSSCLTKNESRHTYSRVKSQKFNVGILMLI